MKNSFAKLRRVAVDLTPVLPGGENGGAKLVAIGLLQQLSRLAPDIEFILLTDERSHTELGILDSANVRRVCVARNERTGSDWKAKWTTLRKRLQTWLATRLPGQVISRLKEIYLAKVLQPRRGAVLKDLHADLLFCPFTAPRFFDLTIPIVSVVHDLQHKTYPQYFSIEERAQRDWDFREACRVASRLVCVSNYVRGTVLASATVAPERVKTLYTCLSHRLDKISQVQARKLLDRWGLQSERFLLYPANFWPHKKNHQMLLTAFGMFVVRHPQSDMQLVCTGALDDPLESLRIATARMGLERRVHFPGFMPDSELAALFQFCQAVLFPSLYEGFGMPVLEAMAFGKVVLCSNVTSLPEIAGDAALFFDPRKPTEIVNAICRLESDSVLAARLIERGYQRVQDFSDSTKMAQQYLQVFREAVGDPCM